MRGKEAKKLAPVRPQIQTTPTILTAVDDGRNVRRDG
jgi:hypothetical protein